MKGTVTYLNGSEFELKMGIRSGLLVCCTKKAGCLPLSILPYVLLLNQLPQVSFNKEIVPVTVANLATRSSHILTFLQKNCMSLILKGVLEEIVAGSSLQRYP